MLVMLDLDNTLVDREAAVAAWVDEFVAARGLGDEDRTWILEQDQDGYADRRTVFQLLGERYGWDRPIETALADYRGRVIELAVLAPGAVDCLVTLRDAGHALAIVSNGSSGQQHGKIDQLALRDLVDVVVVSGDLDIKKPDARIFETAGACARVELGDAWMVGDSPLHDIVGAARCGIRTVWIHRDRRWADMEVGEGVQPNAVVGSLVELPAIIG